MLRPVEVEVELARGLSAASEARSAVRELLGDGASDAFVSDAVLATSELVTNALVHSDGVLALSAYFDRERGWLRVEVSDSTRSLPRIPDRAPNQVGGLGLGVVAQVSSAWGSFPIERGKTVWFELLHSPVAAGDGQP